MVICFVLLARKKTRRAGIFCGLSLLIAYVSGEVVLKNLIQRPRPFTLLPGVSLLTPPPGSSSFPSGHTGSSFACAAAIFLLNKKWGVPALALAALIAFFPALPVGPLSDRPARGRAARGGKRAARALALPQAAAADARGGMSR